MSNLTAILSIDPATNSGVAWRLADGSIGFASINTSLAKAPLRARVLREELKRLIYQHEITQVFFEDVRRHNSAQSAHLYGAFKSAIYEAAESGNTEITPVGVGKWKKAFCGTGNAFKERIRNRARELGYKPHNYDEADALGILHYGMKVAT